jgi:phosphoribosylamine--glycine ligase
MKILVVGSGGREHALCWKLSQSKNCEKLYCAPGNAGIASFAECVAIAADDVDALVKFAKEQGVGFVVVGPEAPLVAGLVDKLEATGIPAFGPSAKAALLEGSKGFMKDIAAKYNVPTAWYGRFTEAEKAKAFIREKGAPIVVKADGLAAGKGVTVCTKIEEALAAVDQAMNDKAFGEAGNEVVIEEFLAGEEASFFVLVDGKTAIAMGAAQDHKAVGDGDTGPNTGGMGAYSPAPIVTPSMAEEVMEKLIMPTVRGMAAEGRPFKGVLFAGLMIDEKGPKLLEFNVRFGDPECQALMARLDSDLLELLMATSQGRLDQIEVKWRNETALVVVMAAEGYPGNYLKNTEINGLDDANQVEGVIVLHAGTKEENGRILATGGRVLGVTAIGKTAKEAQSRAYQAVDKINWPKGFCRRDIGWRAVKREG